MTVTTARDELVGLEALVDFLDASPLKYEVIDGAVVVSPPANGFHQELTGDLFAQLRRACPPELIVWLDFGWRYDAARPRRYLEPDLAVLRRAEVDLAESLHEAAPLLAVETRSPSTWRLDEGPKGDIYAAGGVQSYWLVDPVTRRLRVLELRGGAYEETAVLEAGGELALTRPFPVTLRL